MRFDIVIKTADGQIYRTENAEIIELHVTQRE